MTLFEKCIVTSQVTLLIVLGVFGLSNIKQNINTLKQDKTKMQTQITDLEQRYVQLKTKCVQLKTEEEQLIFDYLMHGSHVAGYGLVRCTNLVKIDTLTPKQFISAQSKYVNDQNIDSVLKNVRPLKDGYKYACGTDDEMSISGMTLLKLRFYGELPCEYDYNDDLGWTQPKSGGWRVVIKDGDDNILTDDQVQDAFATPSMPKPTSEE